MKTDQEWMKQARADGTVDFVAPFTAKQIRAIQADTLRHAAKLSDNYQPPDGMSVQSGLAQELEAEADKLDHEVPASSSSKK